MVSNASQKDPRQHREAPSRSAQRLPIWLPGVILVLVIAAIAVTFWWLNRETDPAVAD